jgi:hypothetical protein
MKGRYHGTRLFSGRTAVIATMHGKEKVIAPILERALGVTCITPSGFDTDTFGTFSGEIARKDSPMQTLRAKALAALAHSGETMAVASEDSFGPHPSYVFVPGNEEMVLLMDLRNNIEIRGWYLTERTNYSQKKINELNDLEEFKKEIGYPAHGIILKTEDAVPTKKVWKDISTAMELTELVCSLLEKGSTVSAETDMRAMQNPTRMNAIEKAVVDLVKNCKSHCPECNAPGFVIVAAIPGLRCQQCNFPTESTKAFVHNCKKCHYTVERVKKGVDYEEPMFCGFCNP